MSDQLAPTASNAVELLAKRFRGDSAAFSAIRLWLRSRKIPHKVSTF